MSSLFESSCSSLNAKRDINSALLPLAGSDLQYTAREVTESHCGVQKVIVVLQIITYRRFRMSASLEFVYFLSW
jgi:hypothetical protein